GEPEAVYQYRRFGVFIYSFDMDRNRSCSTIGVYFFGTDDAIHVLPASRCVAKWQNDIMTCRRPIFSKRYDPFGRAYTGIKSIGQLYVAGKYVILILIAGCKLPLNPCTKTHFQGVNAHLGIDCRVVLIWNNFCTAARLPFIGYFVILKTIVRCLIARSPCPWKFCNLETSLIVIDIGGGHTIYIDHFSDHTIRKTAADDLLFFEPTDLWAIIRKIKNRVAFCRSQPLEILKSGPFPLTIIHPVLPGGGSGAYVFFDAIFTGHGDNVLSNSIE